MRSPSKTICFCRIWGDFIIVIHGVTFESQSPQTRMITDFFLVLSVLNEQHFFNEFYSRDTSKKVRAVKRTCAENGKFMGAFPPFGYKRDPKDKHHLIIDEETAPVVRRIFAMRTAGKGYHLIAATLNEEGVPSPGMLFYQQKGHENPRRSNNKWADQTIKDLMRN